MIRIKIVNDNFNEPSSQETMDEILESYYKDLEDSDDLRYIESIENDSNLSSSEKERIINEKIHEMACRVPSPELPEGQDEVWEGLEEFLKFEEEVKSFENHS